MVQIILEYMFSTVDFMHAANICLKFNSTDTLNTYIAQQLSARCVILAVGFYLVFYFEFGVLGSVPTFTC